MVDCCFHGAAASGWNIFRSALVNSVRISEILAKAGRFNGNNTTQKTVAIGTTGAKVENMLKTIWHDY